MMDGQITSIITPKIIFYNKIKNVGSSVGSVSLFHVLLCLAKVSPKHSNTDYYSPFKLHI
jgi:hypothetical protein